jgi:hypothetical protein
MAALNCELPFSGLSRKSGHTSRTRRINPFRGNAPNIEKPTQTWKLGGSAGGPHRFCCRRPISTDERRSSAMQATQAQDARHGCRVRPRLPVTGRQGPSVAGERTDAVVAVRSRWATAASFPSSPANPDAAARRHPRWLASAGRRRAVALVEGRIVPSDPIDPSEDIVMRAHRTAVLHRRIAVPGLATCLWCGEQWPCQRRRWADEVLGNAGDDTPRNGA